MKATVQIDSQACIGTGLCQAMCPELFELTDAGHSVVLEPELRDDNRITLAHNVAGCCPTEAIVITEREDAGIRFSSENER